MNEWNGMAEYKKQHPELEPLWQDLQNELFYLPLEECSILNEPLADKAIHEMVCSWE